MAWSLPGSPQHGMVTARLTSVRYGHCRAHHSTAWSLPDSPQHGMVTARLTTARHGHCQAHLSTVWSLPGSPQHGMVAARLTSAWHGHCQAASFLFQNHLPCSDCIYSFSPWKFLKQIQNTWQFSHQLPSLLPPPFCSKELASNLMTTVEASLVNSLIM